MQSFGIPLLLAMILPLSHSFAQRLKKADKLTVSNMKLHVDVLGKATNEKLTSEYIGKQFQSLGLQPRGDSNSWYQHFEIYDGKELMGSNYFNINNHNLLLNTDYFPFAFSASTKAEGSVAIALAESGYPWFKHINDLVGDEKNIGANISELIRNKAEFAAQKGATALIIYNNSENDLSYDSMDRSETLKIPVIFLTRNAFKKYCNDESAIIDVKLNVALRERKYSASNVIAFSDNGADSTVVTVTNTLDKENTAALLELARLSKNIQPKKNNYLFVAYSPARNGKTYCTSHMPLSKINYLLDLDSLSTAVKNDGLTVVKESMNVIKTK